MTWKLKEDVVAYFKVLLPAFVWRESGKLRKPSARIASLEADI
jgi:hypothetical protein